VKNECVGKIFPSEIKHGIFSDSRRVFKICALIGSKNVISVIILDCGMTIII
jgi:hypothetical protein